jgi:hypothetical protein
MSVETMKLKAASLDIRRENYKRMHAGTAERMGKSLEFKMCRTLTQMRKCLWGVKARMKR